MGIASRLKPVRLTEKLVQIRTALDLSQNEMIDRLGLADELIREEVSAFERGLRQPPLVVLLRYARSVNISTDVLIDDEADLPPWVVSAAKSALRQKRLGGKSAMRTKRNR